MEDVLIHRFGKVVASEALVRGLNPASITITLDSCRAIVFIRLQFRKEWRYPITFYPLKLFKKIFFKVIIIELFLTFFLSLSPLKCLSTPCLPAPCHIIFQHPAFLPRAMHAACIPSSLYSSLFHHAWLTVDMSAFFGFIPQLPHYHLITTLQGLEFALLLFRSALFCVLALRSFSLRSFALSLFALSFLTLSA